MSKANKQSCTLNFVDSPSAKQAPVLCAWPIHSSLRIQQFPAYTNMKGQAKIKLIHEMHSKCSQGFWERRFPLLFTALPPPTPLKTCYLLVFCGLWMNSTCSHWASENKVQSHEPDGFCVTRVIPRYGGRKGSQDIRVPPVSHRIQNPWLSHFRVTPTNPLGLDPNSSTLGTRQSNFQ